VEYIEKHQNKSILKSTIDNISMSNAILNVMTFNSLRLFRDVIQVRSISRAATLNGISQSAASQAVQELERSLKLQLIDRSRRPFEVTEAGELCFGLCRDVLRRFEEFEADVESLKSEPEGTVRVASIYSIGITEMSRFEARFFSRYPKAKLDVTYLRPDKVYEAVAGDMVDLGLVSYPDATRDVETIAWRDEEMVASCGLAHPLCGMERVSPKDLNGMDFIAFDEELPIRRNVDRYLKENQVDVRVAFHFDNIQTIKEAVILGKGVSLLPKLALQREMDEGRMRAIPLTVPLVRPLGIIHHRRKRFTPIVRAFLNLLREYGSPAATTPARRAT
jgi:LysR family transcriptional regulator, transcriptional activator of the cysJI operon